MFAHSNPWLTRSLKQDGTTFIDKLQNVLSKTNTWMWIFRCPLTLFLIGNPAVTKVYLVLRLMMKNKGITVEFCHQVCSIISYNSYSMPNMFKTADVESVFLITASLTQWMLRHTS